MSFSKAHFIDFSGKTAKDIYSLFKSVNSSLSTPSVSRKVQKNACLMFLEPSTRTQLSFELALKDCGVNVSLFQKDASSMVKGETFLDTLLNLQAMGFDMFVIRHGRTNESLSHLAETVTAPIINAGEGVSGHPTQALLDCYTILEKRKRKTLEGEKVLFVGDIRHSRVVSSNLELMKILGVETAFCAPNQFLPHTSKEKTFDNLKDGLKWATAVMALRTQFERHDESVGAIKVKEHFVENYSLTKETLKNFRKDGLILHPGPFHRDHEIAAEILKDPRTVIFDQVANGRKVRRALVKAILGEQGKK